MGYRGEDASRAPANWGQQLPRPSSPGSGQGDAGSWIDGTQQGYGHDDYDAYASGGGYGYEGGGYPQPDAGQRPEAQYGQHESYGSQAAYGYDGQPGYDSPSGYGHEPGYGHEEPGYGYEEHGQNSTGYGWQPGYDQQNSGYAEQDYGQPSYGQPPEPGYAEPGYGAPAGGAPGYRDDGSGPRGGYPSRSTGGFSAYRGQDAGNDWYGGQPAAASGASFADTGTYALNGRIIDEYGTGPREAMRDPARGYPPSPGQPQDPRQAQGRPQLPAPARPTVSGPQMVPNTGAQERYDGGYDAYPGYGEPGAEYPTTFRGTSGEFPATGRSSSGAFPAAGRNSGAFSAAGRGSGAFPATDRSSSGEFPTSGAGGYGYDDVYGQESYREPGDQSYDDYGDPAVGYGVAPDGDQRGGYGDYGAGGGYQQPYGDAVDAPGVGQRGPGGPGGRGKGKKGGAKRAASQQRGARKGAGPGGRRRRPLGLIALALAVVVVAGAAAYVFLLKPTSSTKNDATAGPLPTASAQPSAQACVKVYGIYCHIENRVDDPTPLTVAELFPPVVNNVTKGQVTSSFTLAVTKVDTKCANAVIGSSLIAELTDGHCSQVLRASYVSGNGKIMGTIGVINLQTTNEAHYAGKVVDENDFIAPLAASEGVAKKLGQGTGVVEAEFKGHYLILTWSEFINGSTPSTTAEDNELEQFSGDLVAGTANISLSQRMVTGEAPSPGAGAGASQPSATASASAGKPTASATASQSAS
jgi:hypothetical protein